MNSQHSHKLACSIARSVLHYGGKVVKRLSYVEGLSRLQKQQMPLLVIGMGLLPSVVIFSEYRKSIQLLTLCFLFFWFQIKSEFWF